MPIAPESFDIYGPRQTAAFVDAAFRYITIPYEVMGAERLAPAHLTSPFHAHEIQREGVVFDDQTIRVIAAENSHYVLMPAQARQMRKSYAYRIEVGHAAIVFTGDTGPSEALTRLATAADVLVAEATVANYASEVSSLMRRATQNHWSPQQTENMRAHFVSSHLDLERVAELASKAHVKAVLLYHFRPSDPAAFVAEVKKGFSGSGFAPGDLDRFCMAGGSIEACRGSR
jgi:ribonuclease BN (tRNA processing enzyme)